ncbi:hypothetical protein BJX63DRAFT_412960 [Aspergillus granulosus]|uniref:SnoaL-like domain-containing protein n=1 Tax=Aspergillus granulosus TaxID=176169 RepID=A0ABR4GVL7_9EURO
MASATGNMCPALSHIHPDNKIRPHRNIHSPLAEMTNTSKRLTTAQKYLSHFATLDQSLLASLLTETHTHEFAPASLNLPGPFTKASYMAHNVSLSEVMIGFLVTVKEYFECEASNSVVVWANGEARFHEELMDLDGEMTKEEWKFKGEYVFMIWMDESGERIERTVEYLDSAGTKERLLELMGRARENLEKMKPETGAS